MKSKLVYYYVLGFFALTIFSINHVLAETENKKPRVVTINIGFECDKNCSKLSGVKNDVNFFNSVAKATGSLHTINITQTEFDQFLDKTALLDALQKRIAEYDTVVFNYSGHGLPFPKSKEFADVNPVPGSDPKKFELLIVNEKLGECVNQIYDRNHATCKLTCDQKFKKNECSPFASAHFQKCEDLIKRLSGKGPYFAKYMKCRNTFPQDRATEIKACSYFQSNYSDCNSKCGINNNNNDLYKVEDPYGKDTQNCIQKYGLLASDFEKLLASKKVYSYIDACYSGLMANFDHPDAVITTSSGPFQLSTDNTKEKIGEFTKHKKIQLDSKYCKYPSANSRAVTLTDYYLQRPSLIDYKLQTSTVVKGTRNNEVILKGFYHCEESGTLAPVGVPTGEGNAK